jgi:REP element-mobilizing transposase RayT
VRGIERRNIFLDDQDRYNFLDRLGTVVEHTETICYAWALIPNHFHLLLQTGSAPLATVMRRLLTGHAVSFNQRHKRHGHLFQNRYKSILCQEDPYLLELVRYIHLNPLRVGLVAEMQELGKYPFSGHGVIMGKFARSWQDTDTVLAHFGKTLGPARRSYRTFVTKGIDEGRRQDLIGGGLIRSMGGWAAVKAMKKGSIHTKSDERILGDGAFVEKVLAASQEDYDRRYALKSSGIDLDSLAVRVADLLDMEVEQVWQPGRTRILVKARSLLCYWAVRELGQSMTAMARRLGLSTPAVSKAVNRGRVIAETNGYLIS